MSDAVLITIIVCVAIIVMQILNILKGKIK